MRNTAERNGDARREDRGKLGSRYFSEDSLDDVMHVVFKEILDNGTRVRASRGENLELIGVTVNLTNPRARLSRTETRGKAFSCLGELCWYLAGSDKLDFIEYYVPPYKNDAEDGILRGAYGPRLSNRHGIDQLENVRQLLIKRPSSRRAVIQLFDAADIDKCQKDVPCTCTLQFLLRDESLHLICAMRSNDAYWGMPHDIFCFTMLQEIMARRLEVKIGAYKHFVGSLHIYEGFIEAASAFMDEGWQATDLHMPRMPNGDPWPKIQTLISAEEMIRVGGANAYSDFENLEPYWADLVRMLQVLRSQKDEDISTLEAVALNLEHECYKSFARRKLSELRSSAG